MKSKVTAVFVMRDSSGTTFQFVRDNGKYYAYTPRYASLSRIRRILHPIAPTYATIGLSFIALDYRF